MPSTRTPSASRMTPGMERTAIDIKPGEAVQLIADGQKMIVEKLVGDKEERSALCLWTDVNGRIHRDVFPMTALKHFYI